MKNVLIFIAAFALAFAASHFLTPSPETRFVSETTETTRIDTVVVHDTIRVRDVIVKSKTQRVFERRDSLIYVYPLAAMTHIDSNMRLDLRYDGRLDSFTLAYELYRKREMVTIEIERLKVISESSSKFGLSGGIVIADRARLYVAAQYRVAEFLGVPISVGLAYSF
jgi:hypothetical protein